MPEPKKTADDLVIANHILAREGIFDAFGHVSVRSSDDPSRFLISRSLSPLQVTVEDLQLLDLNGQTTDGDRRPSYAEVAIHSEIYRARPEINAVVHCHAPSAIPYGVSSKRLRPIFHMAALIGDQVPVWDIRDTFGTTDMLVHSAAQGASLARTLGAGNVVLMRGHGATVAAASLQVAVFTAYYMEQNAKLQIQAEALGPVSYLNEAEVERARSLLTEPLSLNRVWDYFRHRAEDVRRRDNVAP